MSLSVFPASWATRPVANSKASTRGHEIRKRIERNRALRLSIAEAMKREAGVTEHSVNRRHEDLSGLAWLGTGHIRSPQGRNMAQLYIVAHECGHIFLHSAGPGRFLPTHVMEMEAESYAHQAFREHGMEPTRRMTRAGRDYVASWIAADRASGIPIDPRALDYALGRRSPYEPLRDVPETWHRHAPQGGRPRWPRLARLARTPFAIHVRDWLRFIGETFTVGFALAWLSFAYWGVAGGGRPEDVLFETLSSRLATCATAGIVYACLLSAIRAHNLLRR